MEQIDVKDILPQKQLNIVLQYILDANKPPYRTDGEIKEGISFVADYKLLSEILHKLEKDGYIRNAVPNPFATANYCSTFDGRFFLNEKGGYIQQLEDERLQRIINETDESTRKANEVRMVKWAKKDRKSVV